MHSTRSHRHQRAAHARWRAAEARAQAERDAGIPDRAAWHDARLPIVLDLRTYGGALLRIEPRPGYVSVRVIDDDTGQVVHCAALKTALHRIADALPRTLGASRAARRVTTGFPPRALRR